MNPVPANLGAAVLPQVSLVPPEFAQRRKSARMRALALLILVIACAAVIVGWFLATGLKTVAENGLEAEQERRADLTAELASYDYVRVAEARHQNAVNAQLWAGATDIRWDDYVAAIGDVLPAGVALENMQVSQASPISGLGLSSGTPFGQDDLGEVSFSGTAESPQLAADAANVIRGLSGFYDVEFGSTRLAPDSESGTVLWAFEIGARISSEALSGRTILSEATPPAEGDDAEEESDEAGN